MKKLVDAHSNGGKEFHTLFVENCMEECIARHPDCVAIDYHRSINDMGCFMHNSHTAGPKNLKWNDCCNRYSIICDPST